MKKNQLILIIIYIYICVCVSFLCCLEIGNKIKNKKCHATGTFLNSSCKIIERGKINIVNFNQDEKNFFHLHLHHLDLAQRKRRKIS